MQILIMILYLAMVVFTIWSIFLAITAERTEFLRFFLPMITIGISIIMISSIYGVYYFSKIF